MVVEYDELADAADHCPEIIERWRPIGLEALDGGLIRDQQLQHMNVADIEDLPRLGGGAWLLVQFGADSAESLAQAEGFVRWLTDDKGYTRDRISIAKSTQEGGGSEHLWAIRERSRFHLLPSRRPGPLARMGGLRRPSAQDRHLRPRTAPAHGPARHLGAMYGHFGQGCIHCRLSFDLRSAEGIAAYRAFMEEAADLCVGMGDRCRASTATGSSAANCWRSSTGPNWCRPCGSSRPSGIPTGR